MSEASGRSVRPSRQWLLKVTASLIGLVIAVLVVEVALRVRWEPPVRRQLDIVIEPGGKYQAPDTELGYKPLAGRYKAVFNHRDGWTLTNLPDTTRITKPLERYRTGAAQPGIWIFGCSFAQGWGLDDAGTLPWKMQERFQRHDVVNFGVGGYGTLQSLLQYHRALRERPKPESVVLMYGDFHDERNVRTDGWRDAHFNFERFGTTAQPYARLNWSGKLYYNWGDGQVPLMALRVRSLAFDYAVINYGRLRERFLNAHQVSELLIDLFIDESRRQGVRFVLAGVWQEGDLTRDTLRHFAAQGVETVDISADPNDERNRIAPNDVHPSAFANERSATILAEVLSSLPPQ
jgi:hypothetical protein